MGQARIIIVGQGAGGKDYLKRKFEQRGFKYAPSLTTRLPRTGEIAGKDMVFMSLMHFESLINAGSFVEWVDFNGNYYGTTKAQFEECNLFIMTPDAIDKLPEKERAQSLVIFVNVEESVRRKRLLERGQDHEVVEKRLVVDKKLFAKFKNFDIMIKNFDF